MVDLDPEGLGKVGRKLTDQDFGWLELVDSTIALDRDNGPTRAGGAFAAAGFDRDKR